MPSAGAAPDAEGGGPPGVAAAARAVGRHARRRRFLRGLSVSVLTLGVVTAGAEAWLRATHDRVRALEQGANRRFRRWHELGKAGIFEEVADPVRRYAMRPGASCIIDGWAFRVTSHRTRGEDFPTEKPDGEKRILALGDSFCFGMWCDEDETLVGQLARLANEREAELGSGVTWRAVNLGVPGYHAGQQRLALEQDGLALDPDAVVLYFNGNDVVQEGYFYDEGLGAMRSDYLPLPTRLRRTLWHSHLYGWIVRMHYQALRRIPDNSLDPRSPWAHTRTDNQAYTRAAIAGIAADCRERGIPLFFVNQPFLSWSGDARNPEWGMVAIVEWAERLRRELDLPGVSLLGWLRGYADGVDRLPEPEDFLPDLLVADEVIEGIAARAHELARADGVDFETLPIDARKGYVAQAQQGTPLPLDVDFHYVAEAYRRIAELCYPRMQEAGILP